MPLVRQRQPGIVSMILTDEESLRVNSKKVSNVDEDILDLITQMKEASLDWEEGRKGEVAIAMSAVQLGKPLKIVIIRSNPQLKTPDFDIYLNPKIVKYEGEPVEMIEGCLSIPGVYAKVSRPSKIRCRANNERGQLIRFKAEGLLARILQHEIDHIHGKLFTDHTTRANWMRVEDVLSELG